MLLLPPLRRCENEAGMGRGELFWLGSGIWGLWIVDLAMAFFLVLGRGLGASWSFFF